MPYFADHQEFIRHRVARGETPGLRKAQLGGIYSIASHFIVNGDPALVVNHVWLSTSVAAEFITQYKSRLRA